MTASFPSLEKTLGSAPSESCSACKSLQTFLSVLSEPAFFLFRIGASVLSHFVGDFPLVTAFFLFSVGCVNILVGLIFREKVKDKRSILSWRERGKDVLPSHVRGVDIRPVTGALSSAFSRDEKTDDPTRTPSDASSRSGLGFGRQAEKAAGLKGMYVPSVREQSLKRFLGFILTKPVESVPRHAA